MSANPSPRGNDFHAGKLVRTHTHGSMPNYTGLELVLPIVLATVLVVGRVVFAGVLNTVNSVFGVLW